MLLVDKTIRDLVTKQNLIENFENSKITNIGYDLRTQSFHINQETYHHYVLAPGESVFVAAVENINLPNNICAFIALRNRHIRQGLSLDAPVYQPGHKTRVFFRLTNISSNGITLSSDNGYAMIVFSPLSATPDTPYNGPSMSETDYAGLARFDQKYSEQIQKVVEEKVDDVKEIERSIYANVLVILTVFVALFTFLTSNVLLFAGSANVWNILPFDFFMLGCISFLVYLLSYIVNSSKEHSALNHNLIIATVFFFLLSVATMAFTNQSTDSVSPQASTSSTSVTSASTATSSEK